MMREKTFKLLQEKFGAEIVGEVVSISLDKLRDVASFVKEDLGYSYFSFMTAIDWKEYFTLIYRVRNIEEKDEFTIKVKIEKDQKVPSISDIYKGAEWMEREVYDLFGIYFTGHPDLRRILLPDEYQGHPLRKDFPIDAPFPPYR